MIVIIDDMHDSDFKIKRILSSYFTETCHSFDTTGIEPNTLFDSHLKTPWNFTQDFFVYG